MLLPLALLALGGCASTHSYHNPKDPFEPLNRGIYKFNDTLDQAILKPAAKGYNKVMPVPGKAMVHNFFSNLDDVIVTLNDLLQFKLRQAFSDSGRVLINTTVGAFGLVDAASTVGYLKHHEDFGQTLGYWGVQSGPYLMLPFFGPSSFRDGIGLYVDSQPSRISRIPHMRTRNQVVVFKGIARRAELADQEKVLDQAVLDRYSFIRDAYLLRRQSLVYDGNPPRPKYDDEDFEDDYQDTPDSSNKPDSRTPDNGSKAKPDQSSRNDATPAIAARAPAIETVAAADTVTPAAQPHRTHRIWVSHN